MKAKRRNRREPLEPVNIVDCASSVSSLSEGSFKQPPPVVPPIVAFGYQGFQPPPVTPHTTPLVGRSAATERERFVPPTEIFLRVKKETPDWLLEKEDTSPVCSSSSGEDMPGQCASEDDDTAENHLHVELPFRRHPVKQAQRSPHVPPRVLQVPHQYSLPPSSPQVQTNKYVTRMMVHQQLQPHLSPVWTGAPSPANTRPINGSRQRGLQLRELPGSMHATTILRKPIGGLNPLPLW